MSTAAKLPQPGEVIDGKYCVESLLGQGGMGAVFVVRHVQTQRQFALKCMLAALIGDYEAEQRFIREAKLAGTVDHPGVVSTYDVGRHQGSLYMVMELLSGESLSARLARGAYSVGEGTHLMTAVLAAVTAAHQKGIVHRDLKPDNIFLQRAPGGRGVEPKILDFGISKALDSEGKPTMGLTKTGMILGTPLYMSPEQVRGTKSLDQRTDVYALGVILYEILAGEVPYNGNNFADLVLKIVTADTVPPSQRAANIPRELDAVIMRAMHVDQNARFADAQSFARALAPFAVAPVYGSVRPPSSLSTPPPGAASVPIPPQSLTPFVAEARIDPLPVNRLPWPLFAAAAIAIVAGLWMLLANDQQAPIADPTLPAMDSPAPAAQLPPAAPTGIIPTQAPLGVTDQPASEEIPVGMSAPGTAAPTIADDGVHHSRRHHADEPADTAHASPSHRPVPSDAPAPPPVVEPPRPSNDQIIDPFSD